MNIKFQIPLPFSTPTDPTPRLTSQNKPEVFGNPWERQPLLKIRRKTRWGKMSEVEDFEFEGVESPQDKDEEKVRDDEEQDDYFAEFMTRKLTALEYKEKLLTLTTGCPKLDEELKGGIPGFGLTEIVGESGTGKTQLCLQLALTAQLPKANGGLDSGVVYISTESAFPSKRLAELVQHFKIKYEGPLPKDFKPMDGILLEHVADSECLLKCLTDRLPTIIKERKIGLIIVDSIAAVFRSEYDDPIKRAKSLREVAGKLHQIAGRNQITLVVVNQITGSITDDGVGGDVPALGRNWRNFVTTRILICKNGDKRSMQIVFSPHIKQITMPFELGSEGIRAPEPTNRKLKSIQVNNTNKLMT